MAPSSPVAFKTANPTINEPQIYQSQDLVASLPAPVFRLLVIFARPISLLRTGLEILCWKTGKRVESWIVVGTWWGICLGANHAFRWLFPALVFLPLLPLSTLRLKKENKDGRKASIGISSSTTSTNLKPPSTTESVLITLNDLHSIHALLPPSPLPAFSSIYARFRQLGPLRLSRGLGVIWITWIILGHILGYRAILALLGTIILMFPSPTLAHLVHVLSKSLAVRRSIALIFLFTFGSPPEQSYQFSAADFSPISWVRSKWAASRRPSLAFSFRPRFNKEQMESIPESAIEDDDVPEEKAGDPIYFRFEVHENQRWWMGLDWTSALLPQERPSWCDSHLLAVSPPPSFTLPAASSIILPSPTKNDPNAKIKRTATWKWLDDDWSVVRAGPGANGISNIHPSPQTDSESTFSSTTPQAQPIPHARSPSFSFGTSPTTRDDDTSGAPGTSASARTQSIAEQAFTKGLERLKARTAPPIAKAPSPRSSAEMARPRTGSQASEEVENVSTPLAAALPPVETIREKDDATDAEGWVYGDNKWENMGAKGGLGRFTRRRRWHRRAVCTETVQHIQSPSLSVPSAPSTSTPKTEISESKMKISQDTTPTPTGLGLSTIAALKSEPTVAPVPISSTSASGLDSEYSSGRSDRSASREDKERISLIPSSPARDEVLRQRLKNAMGSMGA